MDLIWSFAKHHHQVSAAETIVFVFFNKRLNSHIIMQQQCELSKNENEHILFTDTLRETLQDVHVEFPHATGDLAFECENRQAFYRFANLLERCKVRFKWFQNTRQSLTLLCFNASVLA